ncbi:DUF6801 domain-containing protein [Streptomyces boncukensis]|uniref:DUF6801 domain-containing protein n=1 Tax=Streptomyces boncukensis TaxID=2711219 RepID=A0A6G4WT51_9ACTN|nr:DUF6801 domain-containing protein [Streptomyces boncukensis]NGO67724.1 hypothetical protein [Streptomyces boncukensis]
MKARRRMVRAGAALGMAALAGAAGAGSATAVPVTLTQEYSCEFPLIGADPIKIAISSDMPASLPAGDYTGELKIESVATVSERAAGALALVGVKTLEGVATAEVSVRLPSGGRLLVQVPNTVQKTGIPAPAAAFDTSASGKAPSIGFDETGTAGIDVDQLTLKLTARDASGAPVHLPPYGDVFTAECTLDPGDQNRTLHTIKVTEPEPGGTAGGTSSATTSAGSGSSGSSGSPGGGDTGGGAGTGGGAAPVAAGDGGTDLNTSVRPEANGGSGGGGAASGGDTAKDDPKAAGGSGTGGAGGQLASTGTSSVGVLLAASGALGAGGIATCYYASRGSVRTG